MTYAKNFYFRGLQNVIHIQMTMRISYILGEYLSLNTYVLLFNCPFHLMSQNKRNEIQLFTVSDPRNWILSGSNILVKRLKNWKS